MSVPDERVAILRDLGLSEYASRAYLALLELGTTEARDVARLSRVPTAKIYATLEALAQKGFVVIGPELPRRYAPVAMGDVLRHLEEEHHERARSIAAEAARLAPMFPIAPKDHASDRGTTTVLRGRRAATKKLLQLGARPQELLLLTSDRLASRFLPDDVAALGPRCRVLMREGQVHGVLESLAPERRRILSGGRDAPNPVTMAILEDEAALLTHHVPDDGRSFDGLDVSVLIEEKAIVRALHELAERAWRGETAQPLPASAPISTSG